MVKTRVRKSLKRTFHYVFSLKSRMKIPIWTSFAVIVATVLYLRLGNEQKLGRVQSVWGSGKYNSQTWLDIWTADHFLFGMVFEKYISHIFKSEWSFFTLVIIVSLYEIVENTSWLTAVWNQSNYNGDGIINSVVDIGAALLGYATAKRLSFYPGLGIILGLAILIPILRPMLFSSMRPWAGWKWDIWKYFKIDMKKM